MKVNLSQAAPDDVILDVGANKGSTSKIYMKLWKLNKIIAIEPLPIFKIKSSQIRLIQKAHGAYNGITKFYICEHQASSSLTLPHISSKHFKLKSKLLNKEPINLYTEVQVPIITIDQVVKNELIHSIFLMKIAVEGSELNVLRGALNSLGSGVIRNIQLETHSNDLRENKRKLIFNLLRTNKYLHRKSFKQYFGNFTEEFFTLNESN